MAKEEIKKNIIIVYETKNVSKSLKKQNKTKTKQNKTKQTNKKLNEEYSGRST